MEKSGNPSDEVGGIGVQLWADEQSHTIVIVYVVPNSPAAKASLSFGLIEDTVDGVSLKGKTLEQVVKLIRGPIGTTVSLGLIDPKSGDKTTVVLTREKIQR
jgi:carboxyl-terminal processing protease